MTTTKFRLASNGHYLIDPAPTSAACNEDATRQLHTHRERERERVPVVSGRSSTRLTLSSLPFLSLPPAPAGAQMDCPAARVSRRRTGRTRPALRAWPICAMEALALQSFSTRPLLGPRRLVGIAQSLQSVQSVASTSSAASAASVASEASVASTISVGSERPRGGKREVRKKESTHRDPPADTRKRALVYNPIPTRALFPKASPKSCAGCLGGDLLNLVRRGGLDRVGLSPAARKTQRLCLISRFWFVSSPMG